MATEVKEVKAFLTLDEAEAWVKPFRKPRVPGQSTRIKETRTTWMGVSVPVFMAALTYDADKASAVANGEEVTA